MKKFLLLIVSFMAMIGLVACTEEAAENPSDSTSSSSSSESYYNEFYKKYIESAWQIPDGEEVDQLDISSPTGSSIISDHLDNYFAGTEPDGGLRLSENTINAINEEKGKLAPEVIDKMQELFSGRVSNNYYVSAFFQSGSDKEPSVLMIFKNNSDDSEDVSGLEYVTTIVTQ